jgi:arylsulfatase A-like enzyme
MSTPSNRITRRGFGAALGAPLIVRSAQQNPRPNILWITCEDIGPHIGAYGDRYATTPNIDKLASRGMLYRNAWSNAPVCAPARTTIITGMYPPCTGSEHMRSFTSVPDSTRMFPCYLRDAGYYATNNVKEDYNLDHTGKVWDESSNKAHWRNRAAGQPFFSVFNFTITHESQMRTRPHDWIHDPAKAPLPPYHPDTPEVRKDWAQYYDNITTMDTQAARVLAELEKDGLADDTIVFFYGDHGSGMPRNKRTPLNCGLRVPFMVHFPDKYKHLAPRDYRSGAGTDRLVSFVDLAPSVLSLAGLQAPRHIQGHAFVGAHTAPEPRYLFGFRGRMDERYDFVRSARDRRYVYARNYMPHKVYGQHVAYMFETPSTRVWKKLHDEGKLKPEQAFFFGTKPAEELYDLQSDPHEVRNLAGSAQHRTVLERMRTAAQEHARSTRDLGFLPEDEIHTRSQGSTPYEMGRNEQRYPMARIMGAADTATNLKPEAVPQLADALRDSDSAVRYWGATGMTIRGAQAVNKTRDALRAALTDSSPSVRVAAAEALGRYGDPQDVDAALPVLLKHANIDNHGLYVAMLALNAIDEMGERARPIGKQVAALPKGNATVHDRMKENLAKLLEHIVPKLTS